MVGFCSDIGNVRKNNEDYLGYEEKDIYSIYIVADGMGGHNAGDVASKRAVNSMINIFERKVIQKDYNAEEMVCIIRDAIEEINKQIYNDGIMNEIQKGMGTTLVVVILYGDNVYIGNVGDSRAYVLKNDEFYQITKDHSFVQELIDSGEITEKEAINHPRRNIITRSIGMKEESLPDIFILDEKEYDKILLATDGLFNEVNDDDIKKCIEEKDNLEDICKNLVCMSKKNQGKDNITVMLIGKE